MTVKVREKNRNIRKEALREYLSKQKLAQKVIEIAEKLGTETTLESNDIQRLKAAADINFRLLNKYVPDAKDPTDLNVSGSIEHKHKDREEIETKLRAKGIDPECLQQQMTKH